MFKLPNHFPTKRESAQEWADYAEFKALQYGQYSLLTISKSSKIGEDELIIDGINDESDEYTNKADEIASEIKNRIAHTDNKYPFCLIQNDYVIKYNSSKEIYELIYRYLLLATRMNMKSNRIQNGLDGALLFEQLSACIAKNYFGTKAEVDILGTSRTEIKGFRGKLKYIFDKIGEGGNIHDHSGFNPQDDKVDVIIWKGFADKKTSQLIAFGQCKTGTNWQHSISELNSAAFCNTWFTSQPVLTPIRLFFTAQYFPNEIWQPRAYSAGLVFDRLRIMDYLPQKIDSQLIKQIEIWCNAVTLNYVRLPENSN